MTRNETLQYINDLGLINGYLGKLIYPSDRDNYDDYFQEIWLQVCEVKPEKWEQLWEQGTRTDGSKAIRGYISGLVHRNIRSKNSRLYYKLKKHKEREVPFSEYISADDLNDWCYEEEEDVQ